MKVLVVLGDKTANEVLEAAEVGCSGQFDAIEKVYFADDDFDEQHVQRLRTSEVFFNVGIANDGLKQVIVARCLAAGWHPKAVVHPSAVVAPSALVGAGAFVGPLAVVSSNAAVGEHAIVHIHCSIGHDSVLGNFCSILPGARISGSVKIGERTLVGSNAFVAAGTIIGDDCRIDAMAYVRDALPAGYIISPRSPHPVRRVL